MADVNATLSLDKDRYVHGETITATYHVEGVDELADVTVNAVVTINGVDYPLVASGKIGDQVAYGTPTSDGLVFAATDDPKVFTALA